MDTLALGQRPDREPLPLAVTPNPPKQLHPRSHPLCDLPLELPKARTLGPRPDRGGATPSVHSGAKTDVRNDSTITSIRRPPSAGPDAPSGGASRLRLSGSRSRQQFVIPPAP